MMTSREIRDSFLHFLESKGHRIVPSAPVIPYDDPTLLFTNAGMNQFKDVFLGIGRRDYARAVDTQKCIRVSGKHNDLEEVGRDTYHHTFFEMLGNWSFGDYYKKEAIRWAWELLTEVWKFPKERLWATVFNSDDEAEECWRTETDINPNHILRFGEKDNFWEMGETGPCGPCSEIHMDMTPDGSATASLVNTGTPEVIEIWNLVFIQNNRDEKGDLEELPAKHVDTGMGFERVCAVLQGKNSDYDCDIFSPLINHIAELTEQRYEAEAAQVAMRVIADHIRALTFAIADGAIPSNDGRGYVLRRLLRRAARFGRTLGMHEPFLYKIVPTLVESMGYMFPEIREKQQHVERVIKAEEEGFNQTLDRGIEYFEEIAAKVKRQGKAVISGEDVFRLYDTYGFPPDLTSLMAREKGLTVDMARFEELMEEQRQRSRSATPTYIETATEILRIIDKGHDTKILKGGEVELRTVFSYDPKERILRHPNDIDLRSFRVTGSANIRGVIVNGETPFYPESGGQVGDTGEIVFDDDSLEIVDTKWMLDKYIVNFPKNQSDVEEKFGRIRKSIEDGGVAVARIDVKRRRAIMRNHSATHLLHRALRTILGTHVHQAGSLVEPNRLRFDFTHFSKVSDEELRDIEQLVNEKIRENIPLTHHRNILFEEAKKMGALAFFGEKYGDRVNVVQFGDFTMEFCGGTHVKNTSEIGLLKVTSESGISSGVRRIEAVTGEGVEKFILSQLDKISELNDDITRLLEEKRTLEKELNKYKLQAATSVIEDMVQHAAVTTAEGIKIVAAKVDAPDMDHLKSLGDSLRSKIGSGVGVLGAEIEQKAALVCVVTDDLISSKKLHAGKIVGEVAKLVGGRGGGRAHLATAGGKDVENLEKALKSVEQTVTSMLRQH